MQEKHQPTSGVVGILVAVVSTTLPLHGLYHASFTRLLPIRQKHNIQPYST
jgi:hypothetical protein